MKVSAANAVAIRRRAGAPVLFVNQSAVDVYFDRDPTRLNASLAGAVPAGKKIAANGGQLQWPAFPGVIWVRSQTDTELEVE